MQKQHYDHIRGLFLLAFDVPTVELKRAYIIEQGKAKDVEKCLRWHLLNVLGISSFICDTLYSYLNDDHIDTALKAIMKDLNLTGTN